jgi:preprotein translocase subunit SecF
MMQLIPKTNIDFINKRFALFTVSAIFLMMTVISLLTKGLNFGLDFRGGTLVQVKFTKPIEIESVRASLADTRPEADIQSYTGRNAFAIRIKGKQERVNEIGDSIKNALTASFGSSFEVEKLDYVGPTVGRDLTKKAMWALILSLFGIILYLAFRFNNPLWGLMGVVALFHDVIVTTGFLSVTGREIDLVIIAALLTIAGFSINDTIVIFDRMRENVKLHPRMGFKELINKSINETLSRTVITSLTVLSAVIILYFGGYVINDFAFTMIVGIVAGTYSTIAIATPILYQLSGKTTAKK